ncbi:MAG: PHP domain-containing protein [Clostridia bacterium]|nr:PHP domain-containing protein [Clostridia bacterium]
MIDLHIHTNHSDGSESVKNVLKKAEEVGLSYISITDHETCNAYKELEKIDIQQYYSGKIIPGIELKNYYQDRVIDILAYNIDIEKFNCYLEEKYKDKTHRKLEIKNLKHFYQQAKEYGLVVDPIETLKWNPDKDWGSVVFYQEIKKHPENEKKVPKDLWESFGNFKKDYVYNRDNLFFLDKKDDYPSPKETIEQIHKAGGMAFLAHVHEYKWVENEIEYIKQLLKDSDLDGVECYYSNFTQEQTEELIDFCMRNELYISGGTDFHGTNRKGVEVGTGRGNLTIPENILQSWGRKKKIFVSSTMAKG